MRLVFLLPAADLEAWRRVSRICLRSVFLGESSVGAIWSSAQDSLGQAVESTGTWSLLYLDTKLLTLTHSYDLSVMA